MFTSHLTWPSSQPVALSHHARRARPASEVPLGKLGRDAVARMEHNGWRLIELRPEVVSLEQNRYRVTIGKVTGGRGISLSGADPDRLLEDLACHALMMPR